MQSKSYMKKLKYCIFSKLVSFERGHFYQKGYFCTSVSFALILILYNCLPMKSKGKDLVNVDIKKLK